MKHQIKRRLYISPVQTIVLGFFLLIVVGTILLMMPFSAQAGQKRNGLMLFSWQLPPSVLQGFRL